MEKHLAGKELFNAGWENKFIAKTLGVSEQTVSNWKKKYDWEKKRAESVLVKETAEETLWELINYQLTVLKEKKDEMLSKPKGERNLIDKGDIDALSKMFSSVKVKELEWSKIVSLVRELIDFLRTEDLELAKKLTEHTTVFLRNKRKNL